ncbi:MAG: CoA transferase [Dehalococcoidia bacterium]|nr:CoA transferase [Dehalococcoidia bacterium]
MASALAGIRVIDISTSASGAWCSRMLSGFGADVVMLEGPAGHPMRREAPFDSSGESIPGAYFLAGKRSAVFDLHADGAAGRLLALSEQSPVVVSSLRQHEWEALGLQPSQLGQGNAVVVHITPYGMTGERAALPGNELTVAALSGWAALNGESARAPLRPVAHQVAMCTGTLAAATVVGAVIERERSGGRGQEIDIAELDAMVSAGSPNVLRGQYTGRSTPRRDGVDITTGPVPVADGHFALTISRAHFWRDAMNVLGLDDLAEDPRWEASWYRQAHREEYAGRVSDAMRQWSKADLFEELAARRVVAGPVLTMDELSTNPHLAERGFWTEFDGVTQPGAPFKLSATPWVLPSRPRPNAATRDPAG